MLATISRYSLPIYGFHALFIHYLRTNHYDDMSRPWLDLPWVFWRHVNWQFIAGDAAQTHG